MTTELPKGERPKRCTAVGCAAVIPRHLLMCRTHWNLVPADLQAEVYRTHKAMEDGASMRPWLLASYRAQLAVAQKQNAAPETLHYIETSIAQLEARITK